MKKKVLAAVLTGVMVFGMTACGGSESGAANSDSSSEKGSEEAGAEAPTGEISVISREDGSGTRGAFIELFGIEEKDESGEKIDNTTEDATAENVKSDTYKISRPFNIATTDKASDVAKDFISYILSAEGQKIVEDSGYIAASADAEAYAGSKPKGKIVVAGSSSVTPVMEKLKEGYETVNPDAEIEIQQRDSTTGMESAVSGVCDIGMASRELKDSETEAGLVGQEIAIDGIAVIVNNENPMTDITSDQVKDIYTGEVTDWEDLQ